MTDDKKLTTLKDAGIFHLHKPIANDSVAEAIAFILEKNLNHDGLDHLTLMVSSYGGSLYAGFALTDTMEGSGIPIYTVGLGMIASAGLLIFMTGKKGHRVLTPNTAILSHQYSTLNWGKEHELLASRRANDLTSERILAHYMKHTGLSEKKIRKHLLPAEDIWLSAEEAKELGLCDKIKLV